MTALGAVVFANPVAPHADPERLRAALDRQFGRGGYRVIETAGHDDVAPIIDRALAEAARAGCELAIAAGGDGTVSLVAERLHVSRGAAGRMVMGMVPCGTANVLAHELAIPTRIEESIAIARERPRVLTLDGMAVGERLFLTQVGIGLDAEMIRTTPREAQQRFKRWSYLANLVKHAGTHRSQRFTIEIDDRRLSLTAWQVLIANAATLGTRPFAWGPAIDPTDGALDLCVFQVTRWRHLASLIGMVLTGRYLENPHAHFFQAKREIRVISRRPLPVQGDGEPLGLTPVRLSVVSAAVRVAAPAHEATPAETAAAAGNGHGAASVAPLARLAQVPAATQALGPWWARARRRIGALDTSLYLALNRMEGGALVDGALRLSSRVLDWGELWALAALLLALHDRHQFGRLPLAILPPLWLGMLTVNYPLKSLFRRKRPFLVHERARLIGRRPKDSSFPSGHTAAAVIGAVLLASQVPALAPWCALFALVVAFSRVYLGMHFPADVVAGAVAGAVIAPLYGWLWRLLLVVP